MEKDSFCTPTSIRALFAGERKDGESMVLTGAVKSSPSSMPQNASSKTRFKVRVKEDEDVWSLLDLLWPCSFSRFIAVVIAVFNGKQVASDNKLLDLRRPCWTNDLDGNFLWKRLRAMFILQYNS